jgi:MOSC domain-containing protein YiiM
MVTHVAAVHLIHGELHDELAVAGFAISPGAMGENVTTRGLNLLAFGRGTRLHLGPQAIVEVTGLRNPCVQLDGLHAGLLGAVLVRDADGRIVRRAGIMAIVLTGGDVASDDPIGVEPPADPHQALEPV